MSQVAAVFVFFDSAMLACWSLIHAVRRAPLSLGCLAGMALLELVLFVQAAAGLVGLLAAPGGFGRGYPEPSVYLGYLVASVTVLPLVLVVARPSLRPGEPGARENRGWDGAVAAIGCCAVAVVTLRMGATGRH